MKIILILLLLSLASIKSSRTKQLFELLDKENAQPTNPTEFIQKGDKTTISNKESSVFDNLDKITLI